LIGFITFPGGDSVSSVDGLHLFPDDPVRADMAKDVFVCATQAVQSLRGLSSPIVNENISVDILVQQAKGRYRPVRILGSNAAEKTFVPLLLVLGKVTLPRHFDYFQHASFSFYDL
jgi:hypothetical protein